VLAGDLSTGITLIELTGGDMRPTTRGAVAEEIPDLLHRSVARWYDTSMHEDPSPCSIQGCTWRDHGPECHIG
jgi:hypothetical protein